MSTKLVATQHYAASPDEVYALFCDRDFIEARLEHGGGIDPQIVTFESSPTGLDLVTRQGIPASVLPSIVSSFISGDPSTQRTENWRPAASGYEADFKVTIQGAPATLKGTMTLTPEGDAAASVLSVNAEATVPVPMFGAKIEKVIVEQLTELLQREEGFTQQRLAG